jgi:hypothetical protein
MEIGAALIVRCFILEVEGEAKRAIELQFGSLLYPGESPTGIDAGETLWQAVGIGELHLGFAGGAHALIDGSERTRFLLLMGELLDGPRQSC